MKEDVVQPRKQKEVFLKEGDQEVRVTEDGFKDRFKVQGWVRIPPEDFENIKMKDGKFGHLNLRKANHIEGKDYQIIKIVKSGEAAKGAQQEVPPVLLPDDSFTARCKQVVHLRFGDLTQEYFNYPVIGIDNPQAALAVLKKRYPEVEDLTEDEMKERDITYTFFEKVTDPESKIAT